MAFYKYNTFQVRTVWRRVKEIGNEKEEEKENFQRSINSLKDMMDQHTSEIQELRTMVATKDEIIHDLKEKDASNRQTMNSMKIQLDNLAIQGITVFRML